MQRSERRPRPSEVRATLAAIAEPSQCGVLLIGPPGSGKSFVLGRVLEHLSETPKQFTSTDSMELGYAGPPIHVRPSEGTTDPPLETVLGAHDDPPAGRSSNGAASHGRPRRPRLLVIDDIDQCDAASLCLLACYLDRGLIRLLATLRTSASEHVLRKLRTVAPLRVVRVEPWRERRLNQFISSRLGGRAHALTLRRLLGFSDGNALCLTELVDMGAADGHLKHEHGLWSWHGDLCVPRVTGARITEELERLDDHVRDVLTTSALAGVLDLEVLEAMHGPQAVETADTVGLLRVENSDGRLLVSPHSSLLGHAAVLMASTVRRRRLAAAFVSALEHLDQERCRQALQVSRLDWLANVHLSDELLVLAARVKRTNVDTALPASARRQSPRSRAVVDTTAWGLVMRGRLVQAAEVLARRLQDDPGDAALDDRRQTLVLLATGVAPDRRPPEDAEDAARRMGTGSYATVRAAWTGEGPLALRTSSHSGGGAAVPGHELVATVAVRAQQGRVEEALRVARSAHLETLDPFQRVLLETLMGLCHVAEGAVAKAQTSASALRAMGLDECWSLAYRNGALLAGCSDLLAAQPGAAQISLAESAVGDGDAAAAAIRPFAETQLALAHAMSGRSTAVHPGSHFPAPAIAANMPVVLREMTELARAETLLCTGLRQAAFDMALRVAGRAESGGRGLTALQALHLCSRAQASGNVAHRMASLVHRADFDLATTYQAHADAAAARDGQRLGAVAANYDRRGLSWLAAETASAALSATQTRPGDWVADCHRILERLRLSEDVAVPAWWACGDQNLVTLTDREREIAELAASGWTSPQIATHLHLSQRTIENHLQHSYRKLGVTGRHQLGAVLTGRRLPSSHEQERRLVH